MSSKLDETVNIPGSLSGTSIVVPKKTKETFVVPIAQSDIGTRVVEPTPMGVEPALNSRDIPEDTPFYGPYGLWMKLQNGGWQHHFENDEDFSIYKQAIGNKPMEDQVLTPPIFLPEMQLHELECPCPIKEAENRKKRKLAKYHYKGHDAGDICNNFNGNIFDLNETNRPTPPSEQMGYTTTHPNCECWWEMLDDPTLEVDPLLPFEKGYIGHINRLIGQRSRHGTLHKLHVNGSLYKTTTNENLRTHEIQSIQETIGSIKEQFGWLSDDFIKKSQENVVAKHGGRLMLIRASAEAITDHRGEGEPYRRKLDHRELLGMARTATSKGSDINHNPNFRTDGVTLDSEFNDELGQIQLLHYERDPEIIKAIENGIIDAVSINGGPPRRVDIECDGECFVVPKGVILGESDGIGFTYVVTHPDGMMWRGNYIESAKPGVKDTVIELL